MQKHKFDQIDPLLDDISEMLVNWLESSEAKPLRDKLAQIANLLGESYSANLTVTLDICDDQREQELPLLDVGITATSSEEPYLVTGDSSLQRYIVDGEMVVVPHDAGTSGTSSG